MNINELKSLFGKNEFDSLFNGYLRGFILIGNRTTDTLRLQINLKVFSVKERLKSIVLQEELKQAVTILTTSTDRFLLHLLTQMPFLSHKKLMTELFLQYLKDMTLLQLILQIQNLLKKKKAQQLRLLKVLLMNLKTVDTKSVDLKHTLQVTYQLVQVFLHLLHLKLLSEQFFQDCIMI